MSKSKLLEAILSCCDLSGKLTGSVLVLCLKLQAYRKRSCPAVSQMASLALLPSTLRVLTLKSTPIVAAWSWSNVSSVKRNNRLKNWSMWDKKQLPKDADSYHQQQQLAMIDNDYQFIISSSIIWPSTLSCIITESNLTTTARRKQQSVRNENNKNNI